MKKNLFKPFGSLDSDGNHWALEMVQQKNYPNRFDLNFNFCGKTYHIQNFKSEKDAVNAWELLEAISSRPEEERGEKLIVSTRKKRTKKTETKEE